MAAGLAADLRARWPKAQITAVPSEAIGTFDVYVDGQLVWSKYDQGRFPTVEEITRPPRAAALESAPAG